MLERNKCLICPPGMLCQPENEAHTLIGGGRCSMKKLRYYKDRFFCAVASISLILFSWLTSLAPGS